MKQFEVPYNFDKNLIICLKTLLMDESLIHCIYMPPVQAEYEGASRAPHTVTQLSNINRDMYTDHVNFIHTYFPNKVQLLLQSRTHVLDENQLEFYINLGIKKFCVGSYAQAKILKDINKDFEVLGSITMKVQPEDLLLHPEYKNVFDGFVLFFNYARDFELIQKLPTHYRYVLLVNCFCSLKCEGDHHWFMPAEEYKKIDGKIDCPNNKYAMNGLPIPWDEMCLIRPQDLSLFNPYISIYKIQGREYPTGLIIQHLLVYMQENSRQFDIFGDTQKPDINLYLKKKE